jgi:hypothetical protein
LLKAEKNACAVKGMRLSVTPRRAPDAAHSGEGHNS